MLELYPIFWLLFVIILILALWWGTKKIAPRTKDYSKALHNEQMEFDLRLTYKRFKELYPYSEITYQDYKKMQMERAFKRAVSSEKNKRMVR